MTNLTARPDAGPSRCPQPAPRITTAQTPALLAAASSASTRSSRNGAVSGYEGAGGPAPDAATATTATPARDREGSPLPGRPQPTDPVNGIVTSRTAASAGQLRRRRRWSPAPGSTWHSG